MKKTIAVLMCVAFALCSLSAATMSWKWGMNDPEVKYFRYSFDGGEAVVVSSESFEVRYDADPKKEHYFTIEQSYDGENWSQPTTQKYAPIVQDAEDTASFWSDKTLRVSVLPHESVYVRNSHTCPDYYAEYAFGFEVEGIKYITSLIGLGVKATFNSEFKKLSDGYAYLNGGLYIAPSVRLVTSENLEVALEGHAGMRLEESQGVLWIAPSVGVGLNAALRISDHMAVTVSPSATFSFGDFIDPTSQFSHQAIKFLSVGLEWML